MVSQEEADVEEEMQETLDNKQKGNRVKLFWIWDDSWTRRSGSSFKEDGRSLAC